jgi:hypothetical protein
VTVLLLLAKKADLLIVLITSTIIILIVIIILFRVVQIPEVASAIFFNIDVLTADNGMQ